MVPASTTRDTGSAAAEILESPRIINTERVQTMKKPKKETVQGCAILAGLTMVLATLKIAGVTPWSWLWVLSPLWLPIAVVIAVMALMLIVITIQVIWTMMTGGINGKD